ncbi:MAG: tetratricopeptide repeat protein, partial [Promethearchaeota archaeon]
MKLFSMDILARKKIILIFVIAILIPLLVLSYMGYNTFTERQESTKKLLESNLWISGQAALSLFEEQLLELEKQILTSENFHLIINKDSSFSNEFQKFERFGRLFLLNVNYNMIFPKTGIGEELEFSSQIRYSNKDFEVNFTKAESFEFSKRNYSKAVQHYNRCRSFAQTKQEQSLALEGIGRSYLAAANYRKAEETYRSLKKDYSHIHNKAGHPYGIIVALQLFEISKRLKKESDGIKSLLQVYEKMKKGEWSLNLSSYKFFISEIESILKDGFDKIDSIEIREQYNLIKKVKAPYLDNLIFAEFLMQSVIPKIKETILISGSVFTNESKRFLSNSE